MKDGEEVQPGDRVHIVIDKQSHMLLIEDMTKEDAGHYSFTIPALGLSTSGRVSVYSECDLHSLVVCCQVSTRFQQNLYSQFFCVCVLLQVLM